MLNWVPQCGQAPWVKKVSNALPHLPQRQSSPSGGAVLHDGQAKPPRRGNFATRASASACFRPPQQFIRMNAAMMPNQIPEVRLPGLRNKIPARINTPPHR